MARRHKHEEHANHEAWAIPYGDLITLLLAFFVVMYAMSSVNEGKYRVLSDSLVAAFNGAPKTIEPIQVGEKQAGPGADLAINLVQQSMIDGQPRRSIQPIAVAQPLQTAAPIDPARQGKPRSRAGNQVLRREAEWRKHHAACNGPPHRRMGRGSRRPYGRQAGCRRTD